MKRSSKMNLRGLSSCNIHLSGSFRRLLSTLLLAAATMNTTWAGNPDASYDLNVLVIKYFHINASGDTTFDPNIKTALEANWWSDRDNYAKTVQSVADQVSAMKMAAEDGSAYLKYKSAAAQSALRYHIVDTKEKFEAVPFLPNGYLDYNSIMKANNICDYVNNKGVREVWLLKGAHKDAYNHFESKMAGPFGNVSNGSPYSYPGDMPVCNHTYRVYTHTYDRWDLFGEVWGHQIEVEMEYISRYGSGPDLFSRFQTLCHDNSVTPCYPRDPTRLVQAHCDATNCYGFSAQYFNDVFDRTTKTYTTPPLTDPPIVTRVDPPAIAFDWNVGSPDPAIHADYFSARWIAWVVPQYSEDYFFRTITDDGVRVKISGPGGINEETVIDNWNGYGTLDSSESSTYHPVRLIAGQPYRITMEYNEKGGGAHAQLRWKSASMPIIAKSTGCGTVHNAPNARHEYDRWNTEPNQTDCMDWNPDGLGALSTVSCSNWGCAWNSIFDNPVNNYSIWHWQNMPGRNNGKAYGGDRLRNWWDIHGNWDEVRACNTALLDSSIRCPADVAIKLVAGNPVIPGAADFYYTVSLVNSGTGRVVNDKSGRSYNDPVANVKVNVSLHPGSTFVANNSSSECTMSGGIVSCDVGVLFRGQTREFRLNVIPPNVSSMVTNATVVLPATFQDTVPGNDSAAVTTSLCSPITQVMSLGEGTGAANEEVKVTFTGNIANAAAFATKPTTNTLYVCPNTTVNYTASTTQGSLVCRVNNITTRLTGSLRVNDNLTCTNGGGDVDKFYVRLQQ